MTYWRRRKARQRCEPSANGPRKWAGDTLLPYGYDEGSCHESAPVTGDYIPYLGVVRQVAGQWTGAGDTLPSTGSGQACPTSCIPQDKCKGWRPSFAKATPGKRGPALRLLPHALASGLKWLSHNCADSLARLEQILRFAQNDTWRGTETPPCRTGRRGQAFWGL
jgi:hypothetical protein